jgi:cysteinyl-tRNA synthetase
VRNITDVDDKIIERARRDFPQMALNDAIRQVTETTNDQYQRDVKALGCLEPDFQPRATEHIKGMVALVGELLAKNHAYEAEGEVLFDISSMADYGRLSGRKIDEQRAGARVAVEAHKRNPGDFVLWKHSSAEEPGWDSPWGRGRPGWHLECSVMSEHHLGKTFDIHGGGLDLIFPHHENEIAQSRCAHGTKTMANYWLHNGYLQVEGRKMSKSEGNFITIRDLLEGSGRRPYPGEVVRLAMLATHYRQPIDFSEAKLNFWRQKLEGWLSRFFDEGRVSTSGEGPEARPSPGVIDALSDDLNFSKVITHLDELSKRSGANEAVARELQQSLEWLGLYRIRRAAGYWEAMATSVTPDIMFKYYNALEDARAFTHNFCSQIDSATLLNRSRSKVSKMINDRFPEMANDGVKLELNEHFEVSLVALSQASSLDNSAIDISVAERLKALAVKDYAKADEIRNELAELGVQLMDSKDPETGERKTTWEIKR